MTSVLLVEDDPIVSRILSDKLGAAGHEIARCSTAEEALLQMDRRRFGAVLADLRLPGMSGLDMLRRCEGGPPFLMLTAEQDVSVAVEAMKAGAADFMVKPLTTKLFERILARLLELSGSWRQSPAGSGGEEPSCASTSPAMLQALSLARRVARSDATATLLVGESGAGKEVMASYIHQQSARANRPFVRINAAAIPDSMIEAELFGSVKGAYTDAKRDREGFFAAANGGTLLLDEIGELKPELQAKLLRAIETRRFFPVGASREVASDVRIIAATNRDPETAVSEGRLRADLYYRLSVVVRVPSLRERREDIPGLARTILAGIRHCSGRGPLGIDDAAVGALVAYGWPGNVRELRNVIERASLLSDHAIISCDDLARCGFPVISPPRASPVPPAPASQSVGARPRQDGSARGSLVEVAQAAYDEAEKSYILQVMAATAGNRTKAAAILGISRSTLWQKCRKYSIESDAPGAAPPPALVD